jgi:hypothetical protein
MEAAAPEWHLPVYKRMCPSRPEDPRLNHITRLMVVVDNSAQRPMSTDMKDDLVGF